MLQPLENRGGSPIHGLYLHVPFCFHKCHYCDFYSLVESPGTDRQEAFTERLIEELQWRATQAQLRPATIFVGGGTPTLLRVELWQRLLAALRSFGISDAAQEFTVEANPETVTPRLADMLAAGGVNRVSIGAQSFDPSLLKALERWHDPASVTKAVRIFRTAGITNINLDLIFAIPGQTTRTLDADIDAALALEPDHLSYYGLTYEPNTALTQRLKTGQVSRIDEDIESDMFARVIERLERAGFEQYEVSNWARKSAGMTADRRCAHNLVYWRNENWLGVGPAAASHVDGCRWKNKPHLGQYLNERPAPPVVDVETLPAERRIGEELMLRLRLREGVPESWIQTRLRDDRSRQQKIQEFIAMGMLEAVDGCIRLTRRGLFVADAVITQLL